MKMASSDRFPLQRPPSHASVRFGLRAALRLFTVQPVRAVFAMLGVFLGALLLTAITHVLGAISLRIEAQARTLGSHIATVSAQRPPFSRRADVRVVGEDESDAEDDGEKVQEERYRPLEAAATLTPQDFEAIMEGIPYFSAGMPFTLSDGWVFHGNKSSVCSVMGVTTAYPAIQGVTTDSGRFFNEMEEKRATLTCVLGNALACRLFGDPAAASNSYVRIGRSAVLVSGVMPPRGADSGGMNMDEVIFVPLRTGMQRFSTQDHVTGLLLEMQSRETIPLLGRALEGLLRKRHRLAPSEGNDFSVNFAGKVEDMVANAMELMTTLGFIGAGISFFVGSLGIFSIMILMVHARRTEIGIRRAVGAPRRLIMQQFLFEAGLMAGAGGVLGVVAALIIVELLAFAGLLPRYLNIPLAMGVCLLSVGSGVLAGGYPAWKAAGLEVLAALRQPQ